MAMAALVLTAALLGGAGGELTTGPVEMVAEGFKFTEGPLWIQSGELIFSDIPEDSIFRADKTEFRKPSGKSNGLTLDTAGRLIACEHGNRRVSRTEKDGAITVLAATYEGKRFNSPNDAAVRSDGTIFFTDPPYGLGKGQAELPYSGVFAIAPNGTVTVLVKDFLKPNGIALSKDEKTLYVADTEGAHIRAFALAKDGALSQGRVLCELPNPDGMKVDVKGRIWCTAKDGVQVFDSEGRHLETVVFPQMPANCAFGDADFKTLYVTARTGLYKVRCSAAGVRPPVKN